MISWTSFFEHAKHTFAFTQSRTCFTILARKLSSISTKNVGTSSRRFRGDLADPKGRREEIYFHNVLIDSNIDEKVHKSFIIHIPIIYFTNYGH